MTGKLTAVLATTGLLGAVAATVIAAQAATVGPARAATAGPARAATVGPAQAATARAATAEAGTAPADTAPAGARAVHNNVLYGVSCPSLRSCMSVGSRAAGSAASSRPLAARWTGARWRAVPIGGPAQVADTLLTAISCRSSRDCLATGYQFGAGVPGTVVLAERWNGSRWRIILARNPAGSAEAFFNDVSCTSSLGCIAVGAATSRSGQTHVLAEQWRAGHWRVLTVPRPAGARASELNSISCVRGTCVFVGQAENAAGRALALADRRTGSTWHALHAVSVPGAALSILQSVSCRTTTLCVAVGYSAGSSQTPLTETWRRGHWRLVRSRRLTDGLLNGVSCAAATRCLAVGSVGNRSLSEAWNGTSWRVLRTPRPGGPSASELNEVSCRAPRHCIAAGFRFHPDSGSGQATLAESWNGSTWKVLPTPNP
jgi:hypothetical protein